jgi:hypothetical protein
MRTSDFFAEAPDDGAIPDYQSLRVICGSTERAGAWTVARHYDVRVWLGSVELDLRNARLAPGVTTIDIDVTLGSVEIIAPPELTIEVGMDAWAASVEGTTGFAHPEPGQPVVRLVGGARFGSCEIVRRAA